MGVGPIGGSQDPQIFPINIAPNPQLVTDFIDTAPQSNIQVVAGQGPELPPPLVEFLEAIDFSIQNLQETLRELLKIDAEKARIFNFLGALRGAQLLLGIDERVRAQQGPDDVQDDEATEAAEGLRDAEGDLLGEVTEQNQARLDFLGPPAAYEQVNALRQDVIDAYNSGDAGAYQAAALIFNQAVADYNSQVNSYNQQTSEYNSEIAQYNNALAEYIQTLADRNQEIQQINIQREEEGLPPYPYIALDTQFFLNPDEAPSDYFPGINEDPIEPSPELFELFLEPLPLLSTLPTIPTTRPGTLPTIPSVDPVVVEALIGPEIEAEGADLPNPPLTTQEASPDNDAPDVENEEGTEGENKQSIIGDFYNSYEFFSNILRIAFSRDAVDLNAELILRSLIGNVALSGNREDAENPLQGGIFSPGSFASLTNSIGLSNSQLEGILSSATLQNLIEDAFNIVEGAIPQSTLDQVLQPLVNTLFRTSLLAIGSSTTVALSLATSIENRSFANNATFALGFASALLGVQGTNTLEVLFTEIVKGTPLNEVDQKTLSRELGRAGSLSVLNIAAEELGQGLNSPGLLAPALATFLATTGSEQSVTNAVGALTTEQQENLVDILTQPIEINLLATGVDDAAGLAGDFAKQIAGGGFPNVAGVPGLTAEEAATLRQLLIETALTGIIADSFAQSVEDYAEIVRDAKDYRDRFYQRLIDQGLTGERANEVAEEIRVLLGQVRSLSELRAKILSSAGLADGGLIYETAVSELTKLHTESIVLDKIGGAQGARFAGAYSTQIEQVIEDSRKIVGAYQEEKNFDVLNTVPSAYARFKNEAFEPSNLLRKLHDNGFTLTSEFHKEVQPTLQTPGGQDHTATIDILG